MPAKPARYSERVKEVAGKVLGAMSLRQAAEHLEYEIGHCAVGELKHGRIGRRQTTEVFAKGFALELLQHYGEEIAREFPAETWSERAAEAWFIALCGFDPTPEAAPVPDSNARIALILEALIRALVAFADEVKALD